MIRIIIMRKLPLLILFTVLLLSGCGGKPGYVIGEEDMVSLLVDIHKGEAVAETNSGTYYNDSMKKVLKQSILIKHGVTQEQLDTSLVWYGYNIEKYAEVYDEVIKRLEAEEKDVVAEARKAGQVTMASGDSVNLWINEPVRYFSRHYGGGDMTFNFTADETFRSGDRFQWAFRMFNNIDQAHLFMGIDYKDGSTSYIYKTTNTEGWNNFVLQADSTRVPRRVYGYMSYTPRKGEIVYLDSINLVRTRLNRSSYYHIFSQKLLEGRKKNKETAKTDSVTTIDENTKKIPVAPVAPKR